MKKQLIRAGIISLSATLPVLSGCAGDDFDYGAASGATGMILPQIAVDSQVTVGRASRAVTIETITVSDLSLQLTADNGTFARKWNSVNDFDSSEEFTVGSYKMEAFYGSPDDEGFEKPYFYGSTALTVAANQSTPVSITAKLANAMVSVNYTEDFKHYFPAYTATLHTAGGDYLDYTPEETRPIYVKPGAVDLFVDITMPGSQREARVKAAAFTAKAAYHHKVTIDVNPDNGGVGVAQLLISFEDALNPTEPIVIDLSDDLFNTPAPQVTLRGIAQGSPAEMKVGQNPFSELGIDVIAMGGLSEVTLTTSALTLTQRGWPAEVNLLNATAEQKSAMNALGFVEHGIWQNPDKMCVLDFKHVMDYLTFIASEGAPNHLKFTLVVTDGNSKASEPVSFEINLNDIRFAIAVPETPKVYATSWPAVITTELDELSNVKVQIDNGSGIWTDVPYSITDHQGETFNISVNWEVTAYEFKVRLLVGLAPSEAVTVKAADSGASITVTDEDVWASKVYVDYQTPQAAKLALRKSRSGTHILWIKKDGESYAPAAISAVSEQSSKVVIGNLTPATKYYLKLTDPEDSSMLGPEISFTTETAAGVPNGDFEQLTPTLSLDMNQGGKWTQTNLGSATRYETKLSISISEPAGWSTTNNVTANLDASSNKNSWYVVPSVYNSGLSWLSHQPDAKVWGIGQSAHDTTADIYKNIPVKSGSTAMVIRNVAWDQNGPAIADDQKTGNTNYSNYYCSKTPSSIANRTAGRLYLGSNGLEGATFTSRPSSLSGFYMYALDDQDADEKAVVTVSVLSGSTVIATGTANLSAADGYTEFNVPLSYSELNKKATSVKISLSSSNRSAGSIVTTNYCNKDECVSRGATLTVDALSFNY